MLKYKYQAADQVVDIARWPKDEEYSGIFPKGAREKYVLFCPKDTPYGFLEKNKNEEYRHRYVYKLSRTIYPVQFWVEIIAYRIGCLIGVTVPPAFTAINSVDNTCGALIEFFFKDYPRGEEDLYIDGGYFMKKLIPEYDSKKGTLHNYDTVERLKVVCKCDWAEEWAKIFVFDALIGNTDRHQDNWGLIGKLNEKEASRFVLSPAFDNGTSMGHEIREEDIYKYNVDKINTYINNRKKATNHMKWSMSDTARMQMFDFIEQFVLKYPDKKQVMLKCIDFTPENIKGIISELTHFDVYCRLSEVRAEFMVKLILARQAKLKEVLEKIK